MVYFPLSVFRNEQINDDYFHYKCTISTCILKYSFASGQKCLEWKKKHFEKKVFAMQ